MGGGVVVCTCRDDGEADCPMLGGKMDLGVMFASSRKGKQCKVIFVGGKIFYDFIL